jgi:flagellar basal body-associated protein FliL
VVTPDSTAPPSGPPPVLADSPEPSAPAPRKSRRALLLSLAIVAIVFLLAVAGTGLVVWLTRDTTFAVNSCVKQSGDQAVKAKCSEDGAFTVVSKVERQESCPDPNQPYVVVQHKGANDQVLCLRPAAQK